MQNWIGWRWRRWSDLLKKNKNHKKCKIYSVGADAGLLKKKWKSQKNEKLNQLGANVVDRICQDKNENPKNEKLNQLGANVVDRICQEKKWKFQKIKNWVGLALT